MDNDLHDQLLEILCGMDIEMEVLIQIPDLPLEIVEAMLLFLNNDPDEYFSDVSDEDSPFPWEKI